MASVLPDASERKHGGIFLLHKHKREAGTQEALTPADTVAPPWQFCTGGLTPLHRVPPATYPVWYEPTYAGKKSGLF